MKLIHLITLSLIACLGFWGCANTHVQGQVPQSIKIVGHYLGFSKPDSNKKVFVWQEMKNLRLTSGSDVIFTWKGDSTLTLASGKNGAYTTMFTKFNLTKSQAAKIPLTLLNGTYKLIGVYEQDTYKRSGCYFVYYVNGSHLLMQLHETIGFVVGVMYYSDKPENDFVKANYTFPYRNKIKF